MENSFYYSKKNEDRIEQGDIFLFLPILSIDSNLVNTINPVNGDFSYKEVDLNNYTPSDDNILKNIVVNMELKPGIVITQNCDVLRSDYVSFCEIKKLIDIEKDLQKMTSEKRKLNYYTENYSHKEKYFYLPEEDDVFEEKMAIDFSRIYQIKRETLENMLNKRVRSLGEIPLEHLKVKVGNYFKRFAYDKWYLLKKEEFNSYYKLKKDGGMPECELNLIRPYPWQV